MDEPAYLKLADETFRRILDLFQDVDAEQADVDAAGDVVTITFASGKRCVVNTQRPVKQIWLAGGTRAWHFGWDEPTRTWRDDKGTGAELFETIRALAKDVGGVSLSRQP